MSETASMIGIPPAVTEETRSYWDALREGRLLAERCGTCRAEWFPPRSICRTCRSRDTSLFDLQSVGYVYSYTVNYQRWLPNLEVPFAIVLVQFADHPGVRVPGRLRGCAMEAIEIGMPVEIGFEAGPDGFAIPSFVSAKSHRENAR